MIQGLTRKFPRVEVVPHSREHATEAALMRISQPFILHVCTHGHFFYDAIDPMYRSTVVLTGANRTLAGWENGDTIVPENEVDPIRWTTKHRI